MTKTEKAWLRVHRAPTAAHWNLIAEMKREDLAYGSKDQSKTIASCYPETLRLLQLLNEFEVEYLIVGGYAVMKYGEPCASTF